jgi:homoserine O-acetyltransferase
VAAGANLEATSTKFLIISFDSDWRFDTEHSREIVRQLQTWRVPVTFREIESPWGHDSFLLEIPEYHRTVEAFLARTADEIGL